MESLSSVDNFGWNCYFQYSIGMALVSSVDSNYIVSAFFSIDSIGMALIYSVDSFYIVSAFFSIDSIGMALISSVDSNRIISAIFRRWHLYGYAIFSS